MCSMILKTMGKRSDIRGGEQLDAAIAASRAELAAQRRALEASYASLKDRLTPVNTAAGFLEKGKNVIAWSTALLSLLRTLRRRRK